MELEDFPCFPVGLRQLRYPVGLIYFVVHPIKLLFLSDIRKNIFLLAKLHMR